MAHDDRWLQGVFTDVLPAAGYGPREGQVAMAGFVHTALAKGRHLLAEAGVGTGKTFAYLVPLIARLQADPRPVIVATHTIALQTQLMRDIPVIARLLGLPAPALLAKGREHYVCRAALEAFERGLGDAPPDQAERLLEWGRRSMTGDRAQAPAVPDALWAEVAWGEGSPCGARCRHPERCPSGLTRRRWQELEGGIIVTNHHQFFADLALRARGAHLFPLASAIVLDEAHAAIDAARDMLGSRGSPRAIAPAVRIALRQLDGGRDRFGGLVEAAERLPERLAANVEWSADEEAERHGVFREPLLVEAAGQLLDGAGRLLGRLGGLRERPERQAAIDKLEAAVAPLRGLLDPKGQVVWVEGEPGRRRVERLAAAPRDLAGVFRERLFQRQVPVVLTSATLAPAGDFAWAQSQFGLERPLRCLAESPFDYQAQARLYVARDMPDPAADAEAFYTAAYARLEELLAAVDGRALALFTARRRADDAHARLAERASMPVFRQGHDAAAGLAELAGVERGCLLGTAYWSGVDVAGLRLLVIVKLPFPAPDPLLAAREQAARERGEDPFEAVLLPDMLIKLRQGFGRLIRREEDRGVVAILDPRAATRRYAERIAEALPELPTLDRIRDVAAFARGAGG